MPIPVTVPRLGWTMEQGVFVGWRKQDGEQVHPGDVLFELEGDKAAQEIEALDGGTLRIPPEAPRPGDTVAVGTVLGYLLAAGESLPAEPAATVQAAQPAAETNRRADAAPLAGPAARRLARELGVDLSRVQGAAARHITPADVRAAATAAAAEPTISPRARRVARELGVEWKHLHGSGRTGRIRESDVRAAAPSAAPATAGKLLPITPVRRAIAERMLAAVQSTAAVTLTTRADATNLVSLRAQFKAAGGPDAVVPSYTDFLVKLAAAALIQHPLLNASWTDEGIRLWEVVHIAVAVDTDSGLLAPVVRDVPALSLRQVAQRCAELIELARSRRLTAEQMLGGTFTVTNLGMYGVDAFTPLLNPPQAAILGLGRIRREPVVEGDRVVASDMLTLSLTFDHRVVDGAPAARFLDAVRRAVEQPGPWLIA